jgi:hypothetical protein
MDGTASTWSTPRELVRVILAPQHLKRTISIALIVGTVFFTMNQLSVILDGRATAAVWVKAALTYLTPLLGLQFRNSVSHPTAHCPPAVTSGPMTGIRDHHQSSKS